MQGLPSGDAGSLQPALAAASRIENPNGPAMATRYMTLENCAEHVGEVFRSSWMEITQDRIRAFGETIEDPDPHHMDPDWAAAHSPWGRTISFGWMTASLTTPMLYEVFRYKLDGDPKTDGYPANYGINRLRHVEPVPEGSRIRGLISLKRIDERAGGRTLYVFDITVEIDGNERPALVAEFLLMWLKDPA